MALKISRVLHAGYVFESGRTRLIFDPIFENPFSKNCYAFPSVRFDREQIVKEKFDAVFISHFHDDHCSLESLDLLDRNTPIYFYCLFEELFSLIKAMGFTQVHALILNEAVTIGEFTVTPRPALDVDVDSLFEIEAQGVRILNVVDSWIDYETLAELAKKSWDLILWPFQTMRELEVIAPSLACAASEELPPEWVEQIKALKPRYIVPSSCQFIQESWSWYNRAFFPITYKQFEKQMNEILPHTGVVRMNPSVSIQLDQNSLSTSSSLSWIHPIGNQDVDYVYNKNLIPPTTADIAKNFPALLPEQTAKVYEYCLLGLIDKYNTLGSSGEEYFEKPRRWKLSIYDHRGEGRHFNYDLKEDHITLAAKETAVVEWSTEVSIAKLYGALESGETLTSMYLRINDCSFSAELKAEISSADIVNDPLIRCLFSESVAAYQTAQLRKLQVNLAPRSKS